MRNLPYPAAGCLGGPLAARLRFLTEILANHTGIFNQINSFYPCYLPSRGHDMLNFGFPGYVEFWVSRICGVESCRNRTP
jgi:hypothetical protein